MLGVWITGGCYSECSGGVEDVHRLGLHPRMGRREALLGTGLAVLRLHRQDQGSACSIVSRQNHYLSMGSLGFWGFLGFFLKSLEE